MLYNFIIVCTRLTVVFHLTHTLMNHTGDNMDLRRPRTFLGPLMGLLAASFLPRVESYPHDNTFHWIFTPSPWIAYNKYYHHEHGYHPTTHSSQWHPIFSPYYAPSTTELPSDNHIHEFPLSGHSGDIYHDQYQDVAEAASSNVDVKRQRPSKTSDTKTITRKYYRTTTKANRNKNNKRRRPGTTMESFSDSEETTKPSRRSKPEQKRKHTTPVYDSEEYAESCEINKNRRKHRPTWPSYSEEYENLEDYSNAAERYEENNGLDPEENRDVLLQRQEETTTMSTMTQSTMETINSTTVTEYGPPNGNENVSITSEPPQNGFTENYTVDYDSLYGPSNGNENISITYGPPYQQVHYFPPYVNSWYEHRGFRDNVDLVNYRGSNNNRYISDKYINYTVS